MNLKPTRRRHEESMIFSHDIFPSSRNASHFCSRRVSCRMMQRCGRAHTVLPSCTRTLAQPTQQSIHLSASWQYCSKDMVSKGSLKCLQTRRKIAGVIWIPRALNGFSPMKRPSKDVNLPARPIRPLPCSRLKNLHCLQGRLEVRDHPDPGQRRHSRLGFPGFPELQRDDAEEQA